MKKLSLVLTGLLLAGTTSLFAAPTTATATTGGSATPAPSTRTSSRG